MKATLKDAKATLRQPWLLSILMVAVIPLFPEYIAPLLAVGALVMAHKDAKPRGRSFTVGPIGKVLMIYICYLAFGVLYSSHPFNSFSTFLMWVVMFLAYLAMTTVLTNKHRFDTALFCISVIAGVVGLIGALQYVCNCLLNISVGNQFWQWIDDVVYQFIPMDINIHLDEMRFSSTFTNPNILAEYLVMVLPFVTYYAFGGQRTGVRLLCRVCIITAAAGVAFSFSRGGYLGLAVMLFILCLVNMKRLPSILLSLVSVVVLIPQSVISRIFSVNTLDVGVSERLLIWEGALKAIGKSPIFGLGPGVENFWGVMLQSGINAPHAHNLALQLMVEGGVIALGLIAFAGWKISRIGFDLLEKKETHLLGGVFLAFVCAFIANGMVEFQFLCPKLVGVFMMVMAFGESAGRVYLDRPVQSLSHSFTLFDLFRKKAREGITTIHQK